jgi:hypothetical protein
MVAILYYLFKAAGFVEKLNPYGGYSKLFLFKSAGL